MKALVWCTGFVLLLTTPPTSAELRVPARVAVELTTDRGERLTDVRYVGWPGTYEQAEGTGERQAVLWLSAGVGTQCGDRMSDLKTTAKFDEGKAVIEILGYDYTRLPKMTDGACPQGIAETKARVSLSNAWLKPNTENRIVFVLGSNKSTYLIKRNAFRVEMLPDNATTVVLTRRLLDNPTRPPRPVATILWPPDFGCLYLAGSGVADEDFRVALRSFAKVHQMLPADEVHKSLQTDARARLCVRLLSGTLPPPNTGRRIGVLPGHPGVAVYLGRPISTIDF